jgi:hypothetical protein
MRLALMYRTLLVVIVLGFACRGNDAGPVDGPSNTIDGPGSGSGSNMGSACTSYTMGTIASMRMGTKSGCFELDNVVTTALTASTTNPHLFVEDAAAGPFSAMLTQCESHSMTHPCSVAATVAGLAIGHSVTVKGTYIKTKSTTFEEFFIDTVTDNGATTAIPAATATLADIERGGSNAGLRFQYVSVNIATADALEMYDFTPVEFTDSAATSCPFVTGFGMIPKSAAGATVASAQCVGSGSAATQPPGVTTPSANEVLFATDFFKTFEVDPDCKCARTPSVEPETTSKLSGTLKGMLLFDVPFNGTMGYYYVDPTTATDAPITPTVAP